MCTPASHSLSPAGHSKRLFHNRFNDESGKNLEENVRKSMATPKHAVCAGPLFGKEHLKDRDGNDLRAPMTIELVRRFARRTRNYERIYERFTTPAAMEKAAEEAGCSGFDLMEKSPSPNARHPHHVTIAKCSPPYRITIAKCSPPHQFSIFKCSPPPPPRHHEILATSPPRYHRMVTTSHSRHRHKF